MNNLNEALTEVRKAYRLVHSYQRRILDMTNYIKEHMGYKSYWWNNEYFTVRSNGLPSDRWAYDNIPLYMGSGMLFLHEKIDYNKVLIGEGLLEIQFDVDSGFIKTKTEPNTNDFKASEECSSYMYLGAICGTEEHTLEINWLTSVFYKLTYPEIKDSNIIYRIKEDKFILYRARYDLNLIKNQNDLTIIIDKFKSQLGS